MRCRKLQPEMKNDERRYLSNRHVCCIRKHALLGGAIRLQATQARIAHRSALVFSIIAIAPPQHVIAVGSYFV